jgi:hypothetical protein
MCIVLGNNYSTVGAFIFIFVATSKVNVGTVIFFMVERLKKNSHVLLHFNFRYHNSFLEDTLVLNILQVQFFESYSALLIDADF